MTHRLLPRVALLCGIILVLLTSHALAERRVALVIGNSQYKNPSLVLSNPKNDAADVAAALRSLDFDVILAVDAGKREFDVAMTKFARLATNADAALFYYAGHALQFQGRNYLVPTDGEVEDEIGLRYQMVSLEDIRAAVERADGVKVIVLDACRNNPIVEDLRRKTAGASRGIGTTRGLARIDKALGMVVAYATAADEVAADGAGRNSPFTRALLKRLQEPGLEIGTMFRRVAADVNEQTNGRQRPETYVSLIGEYYLNQKDMPVWALVKDSADPQAFRNFIAQFPSSPRVSDAQYRLEMLERLAREKTYQPTVQNAERARLLALERELAQLRKSEDQHQKLAATEPEQSRVTEQTAPAPTQNQKQAALTLEPPAPAKLKTQSAPEFLADTCKRDEERLTRLRANPDREQVLRFERELACAKLRSQVQRLKESVAAIAPATATDATPTLRPQLAPNQSIPQLAVPQPIPQQTTAVPNSQDDGCKRDEATLAGLRVSRDREQVLRFERELSCAKLRSQVVRLRESVTSN